MVCCVAAALGTALKLTFVGYAHAFGRFSDTSAPQSNLSAVHQL